MTWWLTPQPISSHADALRRHRPRRAITCTALALK
jgi:hypothetical protein